MNPRQWWGRASNFSTGICLELRRRVVLLASRATPSVLVAAFSGTSSAAGSVVEYTYDLVGNITCAANQQMRERMSG